MYVPNSDSWNDPRSKLLQSREWQANRQQVCRSLGHPLLPDEAIASLTKQLDATYKQVAARFESNQLVRVDHTGKHPALTITNLDKLEEPTSLTNLSDQVAALLPKIDLTELLLEIHAHTKFADKFTHVSESNARIDKSADYGPLDDVARGCINTQRAAQHWDDMLRIVGSLKLGTVRGSELIRSLLKSERPSGLALSIMEVGRINKTLYLLNYIDDEDYRRRILNQLNGGEGRHSVARTICYGQRGEIRKRYREGQEDQLGALGLVTNAVILWNTVYMQAALEHLQRQSGEIMEEDAARLSPLIHEHVNVLGRYSFTLTDKIQNGQIRSLNKATQRVEDA